MNCRPGDLAIYVRSDAGNEGRIVRCLRFIPSQEFLLPGGVSKTMHAWEVDALVPSWTPGKMATKVPDAYLRPIRPGDISDEEVRDLYLPKVPEAA